MNVLETEWWSLLVPPEWWAESEDHSILVGDRDGVGAIEISTLCRDEGVFTTKEAAAIATDESPEVADWQSVAIGEFEGVAGAFAEEGAAIREWYLANGALLLYITYSCESENQGLDDAAVDEILDTLALL
jgi:hypothetical protein